MLICAAMKKWKRTVAMWTDIFFLSVGVDIFRFIYSLVSVIIIYHMSLL